METEGVKYTGSKRKILPYIMELTEGYIEGTERKIQTSRPVPFFLLMIYN